MVKLALLQKPGCSRVNEIKKFSQLGELEWEGEEPHRGKTTEKTYFLLTF